MYRELICKNCWLEFSTHQEVPLVYVENSDPKCLKTNMSFFSFFVYTGAVFFYFCFKCFNFFLTKLLFCVCLWRILVGFNTFSWIFLVEKVGGTIKKNMFKSLKWKIYVISTGIFLNFHLDKIGWDKSLWRRKKHLKITKFVGIYLKLKSRALQKWYEFLSWAQKCQKENGQQIFRTTF